MNRQGRQPADHLGSNPGMLWVQLPPLLIRRLACPLPDGRGSELLKLHVSAGHWRAQVAVTHPHLLCRFNSCPTHCGDRFATGPERMSWWCLRSGRRSFKPEIAGSNPAQDTAG